MDSRLFEYGLSIAADLDALFHVPTKTVLSQRDVPGMTRSRLGKTRTDSD